MQQRLRCAAALGLVLLTGCAAENAGARVQRIGQLSQGAWMPIKRTDFPAGDPRQGTPTTPGSQALQDAVIADAGIGEFVRERGIPDAIAVGGFALSIELAYLGQRTVYTLRHSATEAITPRAWHQSTVASQRPLTDAEIEQIDPEVLLARQVERLQYYLAGYARVLTVGRKVLLALPPPPPGTPSGESYGVLTPRASPITARRYGHPPDAQGRVVAWVQPDGPAAGLLKTGEVITAVNGAVVSEFEASKQKWTGPVTLTVDRDGQNRTVRLEPERWSRRLAFIAVFNDTPNAGSVEGAVVVTTGLLDLVPSNDALAWIIGHELAHITLGHTEKKVTAGSVLKGIVGIGILLPVGIVVPGSSEVLGGLMQGVENRFNRDQERDADRLGVHYARAAGYDPSAALAVLDALQEKVQVGSVSQFLDVHPPYPERRELLAAEIAAVEHP